jgi:hypothetical protein
MCRDPESSYPPRQSSAPCHRCCTIVLDPVPNWWNNQKDRQGHLLRSLSALHFVLPVKPSHQNRTGERFVGAKTKGCRLNLEEYLTLTIFGSIFVSNFHRRTFQLCATQIQPTAYQSQQATFVVSDHPRICALRRGGVLLADCSN